MQKPVSRIRLTNVYKRFGDVEAVSDATLSVSPGEVVGFVGPNGAGKTTTISMLMGFIKPTKGKVEILGKAVLPQNAHLLHRSIGYVAGDMVLPGHLTATQYLDFCASRNGRNSERYEQLIRQLEPTLSKPIQNLSRGNKQKIALIAALQHKPEVLILDEPTSGLDPIMQDSFLATVTHEAKRGVTIFMSSHILSEVSQVSSRIVFMRNGKFILDKPLSAITKQLGKHATITVDNASRLLPSLPEGIDVIGKTHRTIQLLVPSPKLGLFLRWVAAKNIEDIIIQDRNLDDVFQELYVPTKGKLS